MAKHWGKSHMAWVRSFQRKKGRRNPWPVAGMVVNPHRRRSARKSNPRRYSRRNPPALANFFGVSIPPMQTILYTGAGFIAPPFIENAIRPLLPTAISGGMVGKYVVKTLAVVGTSVAARFIGGREASRKAVLGGTIYVLASLWTDFAAPYFSAAPAPMVPATQSAYVSANRQSMRAYVRGSQPTYSTLGIPSAAFSGGTSGAIGGTAARFKRM